jgi:hypothetical protein
VRIDADEVHFGDRALVQLRTTQPAGSIGSSLSVDAQTMLVAP